MQQFLSPGIRAMLLSALAFSVMSALVKLAGERLSSVQITMVRGIVTLALSWWAVKRAGISPWGNDRKWLVVRGLLGFVGLHCYYFAVTRLPLADATVIQLTNPLMVAVAAAIFLHEPLRRSDLAGIALGLGGVVLVSRPTFLFGGEERALDPIALGVAVLGAIVAASVYVVVRKLRATEHPLVVVLQFPMLTVPLTLPLVIPVWQWPTPFEWLVLLGVGVFTQIGQVKMTEALHLEPAARATAVSYVQILFAVIFGVVLFRETPTAWTLAGATSIAIGTAIVARPRAPTTS
ncbi:DMT family transporter [Sandaracinus amylolyticus]|uniref:Permease of the drug/metabolite transporter (DMT) superfamily n=1 Tax=Sandaracinus amylolyticus TaxID=927083 RepID=A0A0F6SE83_9BACT|nr:DMT family transporter [Sandaracinus amylolyticus]AKF04744.1 Permease of the drug/metabolite transporter (DMT) superfamily [Sandaracinus amylolyticus]